MNKTFAGIGWVVTLALILAFIYVITFGSALVKNWTPAEWGLFVLVLAYAVSLAVTGNLNPLALAVGEDNRLSLSKAQTLFWTFIVLYSFAAIYAYDARLCTTSLAACAKPAAIPAAQPAPQASEQPGGAPTGATPGDTSAAGTALGTNALIPINFPGSVLLLLGFSVTSLIAAKGIVKGQLASGAAKSDVLDKPDLSLKWLVQTNDGKVDLTRFQVVLWTLVAAGVFISDTQLMLALRPPVLQAWLPDVGNALVLLMGLGQAAYIGGKLTISPAPLVHRLSAPTVKADGVTAVSVTGVGFGATKGGTSALLMHGAEIPTTSWTDNQIVFTVPKPQPWDQQPWPPGPTRVDLRVASGLSASEPVPLDVLG
ncbi:MAG TPA: IPT/TIG domain-containing protein [Dongiaceae bacterium]|nr:IPT/TIG domain-containing protein [Dongiaceae bacterium]